MDEMVLSGNHGGLVKQTSFEEFIAQRQQKKEIIDVFQKERRKRNDVRLNLGRSIASVYKFLKQFGIRDGEISLDEYLLAEDELKKRALSAIEEKKKVAEEKKKLKIFSRSFFSTDKKNPDADFWEYYISYGFFKAGRTPFEKYWWPSCSTAFSLYASGLPSAYMHFDECGNDFLRWISELVSWKCLPANACDLMHQLFAERYIKTDPKLGLQEDLLYVFKTDTRAKDPSDDEVFISEIQKVNSILENMQNPASSPLSS